MPRIRSIKPDFWNDAKLGQETEAVLLTFIGIWNFSDDYGVVKANPVWLKNQIYPYKDKLRIDAFSSWLNRLSELEVIIPFTYKSESFYYIRTFRKHQKVDKPSKARNCPENELLQILSSIGFIFREDGELVKGSGSTRGVVVEISPKDKDKDIGKGRGEGEYTPSPFTVNKNGFFKPGDIGNPPEDKLEKYQTMVKISKGRLLTYDELLALFEVFKEQSLTGAKYYKDSNEVYIHFMNWLQKKDFKNSAGTQAGNNNNYKDGNKVAEKYV